MIMSFCHFVNNYFGGQVLIFSVFWGRGRNKAERIGYLSPFETRCITPLFVIPGSTRNAVQSWIAASAGITILMYIAEFGGQQCN
jgi:hypothetical protein